MTGYERDLDRALYDGRRLGMTYASPRWVPTGKKYPVADKPAICNWISGRNLEGR